MVCFVAKDLVATAKRLCGSEWNLSSNVNICLKVPAAFSGYEHALGILSGLFMGSLEATASEFRVIDAEPQGGEGDKPTLTRATGRNSQPEGSRRGQYKGGGGRYHETQTN